jgi:hypothetical protein
MYVEPADENAFGYRQPNLHRVYLREKQSILQSCSIALWASPLPIFISFTVAVIGNGAPELLRGAAVNSN